MIERYRQGIQHGDVTGDIMTACAALPVVIWNARGGGYCVAGANGLTESVDFAGRWTLADAYLAMAGSCDAERHTYQPIDYLVLDLPLPTSVNGLFVEAAGRKKGEGRQRVKTREYKTWLDAAGWAMKPQLREQGAEIQPENPTFGRHWAIWIRLNIDHQGDVTNRIKALEDLLVAWNVTVGDQWNDRCTVERDRTLEVECRVIIYRKVKGE